MTIIIIIITVCVPAMNVTAVTQDLRVTTVKWTYLSVPLIPVNMAPHVQRKSKDTPAYAGQVIELHTAYQTFLYQREDLKKKKKL